VRGSRCSGIVRGGRQRAARRCNFAVRRAGEINAVSTNSARFRCDSGLECRSANATAAVNQAKSSSDVYRPANERPKPDSVFRARHNSRAVAGFGCLYPRIGVFNGNVRRSTWPDAWGMEAQGSGYVMVTAPLNFPSSSSQTPLGFSVVYVLDTDFRQLMLVNGIPIQPGARIGINRKQCVFVLDQPRALQPARLRDESEVIAEVNMVPHALRAFPCSSPEAT